MPPFFFNESYVSLALPYCFLWLAACMASWLAMALNVCPLCLQCKVHIRKARQEGRIKLQNIYSQTKTDGNIKREKEQQLQQMTDAAVKKAGELMQEKIKILEATGRE